MNPLRNAALVVEIGLPAVRALMSESDWGEILERYFAQQGV